MDRAEFMALDPSEKAEKLNGLIDEGKTQKVAMDAYGITIESVPDEGTKVTVRMPKVREEVEHEKH